MKKITRLTFLLTSLISFSQERIGSFKNDLKESSFFVKEIIPIVNSKNNDLAVFIADAKNIYGYKLNQQFEVTEKITSSPSQEAPELLITGSGIAF